MLRIQSTSVSGGTRLARWGTTLGLLAVGLGVAVYAGAATSGDPVAGKTVFQANGCIGCHTLSAVSAVGRIGPNLDQTKPTFDVVVARVTSGKGLMPAFGGRLTDTQIGDVAAFVVQATGGTPPPRPTAGGTPPPPAAGSPVTPPPSAAPVRRLPSSVIVSPTARGLRSTAARVAAGTVVVRVKNIRRRPLVVAMLLPTRAGAKPTGTSSHLHWIAPRRTGSMKVALKVGDAAAVCRLEPRLGHPCVTLRAAASTTPAVAPAPTGGSSTAPPANPAPPPAASPAPPPAPLDGKGVFLATCGSCHTLADAGTTGTFGPNLDSESPDAAKVRRQVISGGNGMPPFGGVLSAAEIDLVANYVARVAGR